MTFTFSSGGSFRRAQLWLTNLQKVDLQHILVKAGEAGVRALSSATPTESGATARSWDYKIEKTNKGVTLTWTNSDIENGFPVAIMLQYGYGTGTGGYVHGRDYINPALKPIFAQIANDVRKAVKSA